MAHEPDCEHRDWTVLKNAASGSTEAWVGDPRRASLGRLERTCFRGVEPEGQGPCDAQVQT
ncbi:MAG: hypothetical protein ABL993_16135, partial [Vicinamibacterales bacterium]